MAVLPTIYPVSTLAAGDWTDEAGGATDLHSPIDETGAEDGEHIRTPQDAVATACRIGLGDMPADFVSMTSLQLEVRRSRGATEAGSSSGGDDTMIGRVGIYTSGGTRLAGVTGPADLVFSVASNVAYVATTSTLTFTLISGGGVNTKANWDDAELRIYTEYLRNMGADGHRIWIDFMRLVNGVYTAAPPVFPYGNPARRLRRMRLTS